MAIWIGMVVLILTDTTNDHDYRCWDPVSW